MVQMSDLGTKQTGQHGCIHLPVFPSFHHWNQLWQTQLLKATQIYFLMVLEGNLK